MTTYETSFEQMRKVKDFSELHDTFDWGLLGGVMGMFTRLCLWLMLFVVGYPIVLTLGWWDKGWPRKVDRCLYVALNFILTVGCYIFVLICLDVVYNHWFLPLIGFETGKWVSYD